MITEEDAHIWTTTRFLISRIFRLEEADVEPRQLSNERNVCICNITDTEFLSHRFNFFFRQFLSHYVRRVILSIHINLSNSVEKS